jgi:hypothetical protein
MGNLSKDAAIATWTGAVVIALWDTANTHTVLVGTALPFAFFAVASGCRPRTMWALDAGFVTGLVVNDPHLAFLLSSVVFAVIVQLA